MALFRSLMAPAAFAYLVGTSLPALAQWQGTTSTANLAIAARAGDQGIPHIVATADGGFYIQWVDNGTGSGTGYNWWLQRVDACGVPQWTTGMNAGIEVNPGNATFTGDTGQIAVDAAGNCLIAMPTDGVSPADIRVNKISPAGVKLWGPNGLVLGATTSVPTAGQAKSGGRIVPLPDGGCVVGYSTNYVAAPSTSLCQCFEVLRLDSSGAPVWATARLFRDLPLATSSTSRRPWQISDMQPGNNDGTFIVSWRRSAGSNPVTANNIIYAQKFDGDGNPLWNSGVATEPGDGAGKPIGVFVGTGGTGGGLGASTQPPIIPDGQGGAVFGWAETGNLRRAYIQHVLSNGTLKWNNGASPPVSTPVIDIDPADPNILLVPSALARICVNSTSACFGYNRTTGEYFIANGESQNSPQGNWSAVVQKYDSMGVRQWGSTNPDTSFSYRGVTFAPNLSPGFVNQPSFAQVLPLPDGGCIAVCMDLRGSGTTRVIMAVRLGSAGNIVWSIEPSSDSSTDKSRLAVARSTAGYSILAFGIGVPLTTNELYAQDVNDDGTLGATGPVITSQPTGQSACLGGMATFSVGACGNPTLTYQWRKGGVDIGGANGSSLTFNPVVDGNEGSYDCVLTTTAPAAAATSSAATLTMCAADYDCDGFATIGDIFAALAGWFAHDPRSDWDHDTVFAVGDIFGFLSRWFRGC